MFSSLAGLVPLLALALLLHVPVLVLLLRRAVLGELRAGLALVAHRAHGEPPPVEHGHDVVLRVAQPRPLAVLVLGRGEVVQSDGVVLVRIPVE